MGPTPEKQAEPGSKKASPEELAFLLNACGAVEVNRTLDLLITNQLLYQLSYNGTVTPLASSTA